jgi:hypothetical protein
MKYILAICAGSFLFFACDNSTDSAKEETVSSADTALQNNSQLAAPIDPVASQGSQAVTPQAATPTAAGMNPPHGQPGHDCAIAVGAPLNSAPAAAPAQGSNTITPAFSPASAPVNQVPAATAPGMNPPHGQPGHDCAIAVGAPLKK